MMSLVTSLVMGKGGLTRVTHTQQIPLITQEISQLFTKGLGRPCSLWRRATKLIYKHTLTGAARNMQERLHTCIVYWLRPAQRLYQARKKIYYKP